MKNFLWIAVFIIIGWAVFSGESESTKDRKYDIGYDDGFAVGYNSTCKIRSTLINGDWESPSYSEGYAEGIIDGGAECLKDKDDGKN